MSGHSKWATIKRKKGATDAARGRLFTRLIKEITIAAKSGGNTDGNPRLRLAIQTAKASNMPADNIKRAIQKGTGELPGVSYEEVTFEGYGPAGVAILVEVVTDNNNRAVSEMRHVFSRNNGNMGQSGSVAWMFTRKGHIVVPRHGQSVPLSEDDLLGIILDAGADDLQSDEETFNVTTSPHEFDAVKKAIEDKGIKVESAALQMIPQNTVKVTGKEAEQTLKLMEALEEHEDVQNVYSNFDIDEKELASING
ncbi:MAG TPA: YebC/PmpR family DNA-binding transcriptional regulator [Bacteroidetes bacterium]|jgi:YebC/PmpR family DNA-binding regulatory protein|nr:YebC/PmpR family DNA-binding transcriptional regulator [Bacteroidota bacterium]